MQIPDIRTGDDVIDAVVVDEDSVGGEGCVKGAKILHGRGALDRYLSEEKKDSEVRPICNDMNVVFANAIKLTPNHVFFLLYYRAWRFLVEIKKQRQNFLPLLSACNKIRW